MSKKQSEKKMKSKGKKSKKTKVEVSEEFDKYYYYRNSVQSPDTDVVFLRDTYKEISGKKPKTLREDFCGTFSICCEWAKLHSNHEAIGVDLDPEPIKYGIENYLPLLKEEHRNRVNVYQKNVLDKKLPNADVIAALNFSYSLFKDRDTLRKYFKNCVKTLNKDGVFICDVFGGSQCYEPNEEETEHTDKGFSYFWDQDSWDPVTNEAMFYIHFKRKGEKKREKVFTYDWRLWSIPELREILEEAGFLKTFVYWEGTTDDGEGDGDFKQVDKGEDCESWVSYIAAVK
jgi:SAM-dependent methyltransferase